MTVLDAAFWFDIADEKRPLTDIPANVATAVLNFLNQATAPDEIAYSVPLLDSWSQTPVLSTRLFNARGTGFQSLDEVWAVPGIGPARFTEIVRSIAKTDTPSIPTLGSTVQPHHPTFSASETELKFEYELLMPGPLQGTRGRFPAPPAVQSHGSRGCVRASSCLLSSPSFNEELNRYEAQIEITGLLLFGEDDNARISIRMDHRLLPYDWMQPIDTAANTFEFPAIMQLNNSMLIDLEIRSTGQRYALLARDVPCQVGRCTTWPPYKMLLHSTEPLDYYDRIDPSGPPLLRILDATTFLRGPENFLSLRTDFQSYVYAPASGRRALPAIELKFDAKLGGSPVQIDHYIIQRSQNPRAGEGGWANVSGPLTQGQWMDANPPPGPLYYRVLPVTLDNLEQPYDGFPGQVLRVEPAGSVFRRI